MNSIEILLYEIRKFRCGDDTVSVTIECVSFTFHSENCYKHLITVEITQFVWCGISITLKYAISMFSKLEQFCLLYSQLCLTKKYSIYFNHVSLMKLKRRRDRTE